MSTFTESCHFAGGLTAARMTIPNSSVTDAQVTAGANIAANKLVTRIRHVYAQPGGSASTSERKAVFVALRAGTINSFAAGSRTLCTSDATIAVDLKKNGSSVLSVVPLLDSGNTAYLTESGTLSGTTLAVGDVLLTRR